jgi:hypothetical protein
LAFLRVLLVAEAYPEVIGEVETLDRVLAGASLARYGDGELNLARGLDIPCQRWSATLQNRLQDILRQSGDCLVGIPNIRSVTPKAPFWNKYLELAPPLLSDRPYVSAFISRPDSAPWIDTPEYWQALEQVWADKHVTLVRSESAKALQPDDLGQARSIREVIAPKTHAFDRYQTTLEAIGTPQGPVLLCLGPTATVLAVELCARGVQAVDLGHVGMFLRKYRRGEPATSLTPAEKARDF